MVLPFSFKITGNFAVGEYILVLPPDKQACRSSDGICEPNSALCTEMCSLCGSNAKGLPKGRPCIGTRNGNRTHNYPLGGGYYIHLTMQAYSVLQFQNREVRLFIIAFFCAKSKSFCAQLFIFL